MPPATLAFMTPTMGRLSVLRVTRLGGASERVCLGLAHWLEASASLSFPGQGIEARIDGRRVRMGTEAFCHELCGFPPAGAAHPNFDPCFVFLAEEGAWLAAFELEDKSRPGAGAAGARAFWLENCMQ